MLGVVRRDWFWFATAMAAAGLTFIGLVIFGVYEGGHRTAAAQAAAAQLTAVQVSAIEWESIATGQVPPDAGAKLGQLARELGHEHLGAGARRALAAYTPAVREEFGLIRAGRIAAARQVDEERVDPAYDELSASLQRVASRNEQAAANARRIAVAGEIVVILAGLAVASVSVFRFASTRRALEAARMQERLLRETNKAKTDLISVVSHDLRTPLTSIVGYLEILREADGSDLPEAERRQFLEIIQRNADRLLSIVNDLLFISRAEEHRLVLEFTGISLGDVAAEVVESQRLRARMRDIDLELAVRPAAPVWADRRRIEELVENLLSNGIKFTPPGGSVRVSSGQVGDRAWLEVADTGVGISPSDQAHLFERFFRSSQVVGTPGTGLGLAIVKAIVDAHDGSIGVRSDLGRGTTFRVEFPVHGQPAGEG